MDKTQFWRLIEASHADDAEKHSENLKAALTKLGGQEIAAFSHIFDEFDAAAHRWDLWAVAYIINGGCSDDCFSDFRSMLIRRGEVFYNAMLQHPEETALKHDLKEGDWEEMFGYCISEAFEEVSAEAELPEMEHPFPAQPAGHNWNDDELPALFPRLCQKFG